MPTRRSTPSSPLSRSCSTTSDSTTRALPARVLPARALPARVLPARALPAPTRRSRKTGCCGARAGNVAAEHMFARDSGGGRMRVLGVDPGLTRCGLGVVEGGPGVTLRLVGTTVITTPAVTGSGRADKAQVTHMVTRLLRMPDPPRPADAADALALAICHLWRGGAQARLAAAAAAVATGGAGTR